MQFFGLHRNIYKLARYGRTHELLQERARERQKVLGHWEQLKNRNVPEQEIAAITGISRSVYYRRRKALNLYGFKGLEDRSKRPQKLRTSQIPEAVRNIILKLRQDNPTYGKAKLTVILRRDHGITISESSVGRILKHFMDTGVIQRHQASVHAKARRRRRIHAQRLRYGTKAQRVGELIQIDHMSVTKNGFHFKHFQAICPITKVLVAQIYSNASSSSAAHFLDYVRDQLPFPIRSIQVDGGSKSTSKTSAKTTASPSSNVHPNAPSGTGMWSGPTVPSAKTSTIGKTFWETPSQKSDPHSNQPSINITPIDHT